MPPRDLDLTSLVAGVSIALAGTLLLLDALGVVALGIVGALSVVFVGIGLTVAASGVVRARGR